MGRIISAFLALSLFATLTAATATAATLSWTFTLDESKLSVRGDASGGWRIEIDGYGSLEYIGYPALPYRVVSVLLPQGESVNDYRLEVRDEIGVSVPGALALYGGVRRDDGAEAGLAVSPEEVRSESGIFPKWRARHLGTSANVAIE